MELTVGKAARMFKISRTTLLYYDSIGLLKPSGRSGSGYRIYNEKDINRLKQIMLYRGAGVPLTEIMGMISAEEFDIVAVLLKRLGELSQQINSIKSQQDIIVRILKSKDLYGKYRNMDRGIWANLLKTAGITEESSRRWHADFERNSPGQHHNLLSLLGLEEDEILKMREYYRGI